MKLKNRSKDKRKARPALKKYFLWIKVFKLNMIYQFTRLYIV